jgi:hypothetical protein
MPIRPQQIYSRTDLLFRSRTKLSLRDESPSPFPLLPYKTDVLAKCHSCAYTGSGLRGGEEGDWQPANPRTCTRGTTEFRSCTGSASRGPVGSPYHKCGATRSFRAANASVVSSSHYFYSFQNMKNLREPPNSLLENYAVERA